MIKITFSFVASVFIIWFLLSDNTVTLGEGIKASTPPVQVDIETKDQKTLIKAGYDIQLKARFDITAKILSKKNYTRDAGANLSKTDLALGWGTMSDEAILDTITIRQSRRWYHWKTPELVIPRRDIERQSANMHLIPASDAVQDVIDDAKEGQIIHLKGYLVNARNEDGFVFKSSLTRNDTGDGACEVIYVEHARI